MNKEEFEKLGYEIEVLPSGYLNILNSLPFRHNGTETICCMKGKYMKTTNSKSIKELLDNLFELKTVGESSVRPVAPDKKKTKAVQPKQEEGIVALTDQPLAAFLVDVPEAPIKTKRKKKS